MIHRQNNVLKTSNSLPDFAASYTMNALPVGAVAVSFTGNTATVDAGHGFAAGDKVLVYDGTTATFVAEALSSVTGTTLVWSSATPTIAATNLLCNLGPDTASGATPALDASPMVIYSDADVGTVITNAKITCDTTGNYDYYSRGDGRNWELIRDSSGTVAAVIDGWSGVASRFNVADWGAAIDGSTDDALRANSAVLAANAIGGGTVFFPEGDTEVAATITHRSNVGLLGCGISSKISMTSTILDLITVTTVTDASIKSLFLEGGSKDESSANDGGDGIDISTSSARIHIDSCHFEKFDTAIWSGVDDAVNVTNCTGKEIAGAFCHWNGTTNSNVSNCQFDGSRTVGNATNCFNFVWFSFGASNPTKNCSVVSNQINNTAYEAINFKSSFCTAIGNTMVDCGDFNSSNISMASGSGESAQPVEGGTYNTISGNTIRNPGFQGIGVEHAAGSNTLSGHHNTISGNIIESAGATAINLQQDASDNIVMGNIIDGAANHGISLGATSENNLICNNRIEDAGTTGGSKRGILVQGGAGNTINGNYVFNSDTHGIYMSGTCTDTAITNNVVIDSGRLNTTLNQDGISDSSTSTGTFISGNKCWSEDSVHQRHGILVGSNSTAPMVVGNDCRGNVDATNGINLANAVDSIASNNSDGATALPAKAAATTTNLPADTDVISITGTTNITGITTSWPGRRVSLVCAASGLTISDGNNLLLVGDFVTDSANDCLTLVCDGTNWIEVSRSDVA